LAGKLGPHSIFAHSCADKIGIRNAHRTIDSLHKRGLVTPGIPLHVLYTRKKSSAEKIRGTMEILEKEVFLPRTGKKSEGEGESNVYKGVIGAE